MKLLKQSKRKIILFYRYSQKIISYNSSIQKRLSTEEFKKLFPDNSYNHSSYNSHYANTFVSEYKDVPNSVGDLAQDMIKPWIPY
ncbi:MAG: hypothetical protein HRU36_03785 [Rickettsiales bacterium]|nr:hypothetical protein [Rickettsiales bacterium]